MDRRLFLQSAVAGSTLPLVFCKAFASLVPADHSTTPTPSTPMKIVIAADPFALSLRDVLLAHLKEKGHDVIDVGSDVPYYEGAQIAAKMLQDDEAERAILICGTGMGMSIIANRFKGVVASVVESVYAAGMCRSINNANALCLGSMLWGEWMAKDAVDVFLATKFTQGLEPLTDYLKDAEKKVEAIRP